MVLGRFFGRVFLLILSIFIIVIGIILTITIFFSFIGIPLLVFGIILFLVSLLSLIFGTLGNLISLFKGIFVRKRPFNKGINKETRKEDNIIEVEKKDGVYRAKKKSF